MSKSMSEIQNKKIDGYIDCMLRSADGIEYKKYEGIDKITADTHAGVISILPGHCDLMVGLKSCVIYPRNASVVNVNLKQGVLLVANGVVSIICDSFEKSE